MALTTAGHDKARHLVSLKADSAGIPARWTKAEINAVMDALETWIEAPAQQSAISGEIDTAAPGPAFTGAEKRFLFGVFCRIKFDADGAT